MTTMSSAEVQKNFGAVIDRATAGESIRVTRYGRPGVFVIADTEASRALVRKLAARRMVERLQSLPATAAEPSQADINALIEDCFAR
ncbi:MAG: type II toxin-antitoxin system prevent-host-death family antitoxin [Pseudomonadota bacterium]|nr:type II toxin-antitoxin system prevent-host-death family antitoxin [Pseudomonadota bacterium]